MAFEFMNDGDESPQGDYQPYELGTQDSFRRNLSVMGMKDQPSSASDTGDKVKVAKAHAAVEKGYGKAQQVLSSVTTSPYERMMSPFNSKDLRDIDSVRTRVEQDNGRTKAANHADDLRNLANRPTMPPEYAQSFSDAADAMLDAHVARATLDQMRGPGGPLALSQEEKANAAAALPDLDKQINDLTQQAQTQGEFNKKETYSKINALKQQRQRIADMGQQRPGEINDPTVNMDHAFTAGGLPRPEAIQALTEMRRLVNLSGIPATNPVSPLSFFPTYVNLISHIFKPDVRDKLHEELGPPPPEQNPPDQEGPPKPRPGNPQQSAFGSDKLEQDPRFQQNQQMIAQNQSRHQQILQELAQSGTFKNVGDVLGFVLTSFILGPKMASLFFSNMLKNGTLRNELDRLDHETTGLYHRQNSYMQIAQHARAMAATEEHQRALEAENARHHWAVENYMKTKKVDTKGMSPEDKETHMALQQSMRMNFDKVKDLRDQAAMAAKRYDFKTSKAKEAEYFKAKTDYEDWVKKTIAPWYNKRGIDLIRPAGTELNEKTFE